MFKSKVIDRMAAEFGSPSRVTVKVTGFDVGGIGVVVQTDQPNKEDAAYIWLPYPPDNEPVPEMALEYPGEAGRHSGTYPSPRLEKGKPALKLILRTEQELNDIISYINAFKSFAALPQVKASLAVETRNKDTLEGSGLIPVDVAAMPKAKEMKPRREAIPRTVQREVWQRDGGKCVECDSKEKLCFDHIVPFSRGGSNTVRNLQLLCEGCNLSKGNRI
ncbi:MAG: HNH endonuclease [Methylococcales bacterium]